MKKGRMRDGRWSTEIGFFICAASQQIRLIGVRSGTTHCCKHEQSVLVGSTQKSILVVSPPKLWTSADKRLKPQKRRTEMEIVYQCCTGLDIHKKVSFQKSGAAEPGRVMQVEEKELFSGRNWLGRKSRCFEEMVAKR